MDDQSKLNEIQRRIKSREDFIFFLENLSNDLKENPSDWENGDLENFLEAMAAWITDMDGYYKNIGVPVPNNIDWQFLGGLLLASRIYE